LACALPSVAAACGSSPSSPERTQTTSSAYTTQCPGPTVEGVDVSDFQPGINWGAVKAAGRDFAFMKATQGTYNTQSTFSANWAGAKAAGVLRSAYHFFDPTEDGVAQANHFLSVVGHLEDGDLPPMLDIECPDGDPNCEYTGNAGSAPSATIIQRALDWLHTVESATGRKAIVYSFPAYFPDLATNDSALAAYPLFIATLSNCASVPPPWSSAKFWQYSWTGSVSGISQQVDLDRFFGTLADLLGFASTCSGAGQSCSGAGKCCTGLLCTSAAVCATCLPPGDACASDSDCCGLSVCDATKKCSSNPLLTQAPSKDWVFAFNWPTTDRAEVFVRRTDGSLAHTYANGETDTWLPLQPLGGAVECGGSGAFWLKNSDNREGYPEVFVPRVGRTAEHFWWDTTSQLWTSPVDFGGAGLARFTATSWADGHTELFALGPDSAVWHKWWDLRAAAWSDWTFMGGSFVDPPTAMTWPDGRAELYATDAEGTVWHNLSGTNPGGWSGWLTLGGPNVASRAIPIRWPDGHAELFARDATNHLVHSEQVGGAWSTFSTLAATTTIEGEPSAVIDPGATPMPEVFVRSATGAVGHLWNTAGAGGDGWNDWVALGTLQSQTDPFAWTWTDGHVEVFGVDGTGGLTVTRRTDQGGWTPWSPIGGTVDNCANPTSVPPLDATDAGADADFAGPGPDGANNGGASGGCGCRLVSSGEQGSGFFAASACLLLLMVRRRQRGGAAVLCAACAAVALPSAGCAAGTMASSDGGGGGEGDGGLVSQGDSPFPPDKEGGAADAPAGCPPGSEGADGGCVSVAAALDGFRIELACTGAVSGFSCPSAPKTSGIVTLGGDPAVTYSVRIRVRGVVEQKTYTGGTNDGAYWQIGGTPGSDTYNVYELDVPAPAGIFYMNRGASNIHYCVPLDYEQTVLMAGGTTVKLAADPVDAYEIANLDETGQPILVQDVPPYPTAFDGQFVQLNVVSVVPAPVLADAGAD
jgi:lysozyme